MSRHATFENFGMAFLTLFQVSTGDNWNGIMKVQTSHSNVIPPRSRSLTQCAVSAAAAAQISLLMGEGVTVPHCTNTHTEKNTNFP